MLNIQIVDFAEALLRADVASNQGQIFVSQTQGFPSANAGTNDCFYIKVIRSTDGAIETMRVTLTQGQGWMVDRAVGFNEVALDFCQDDVVQTGVLAPAVDNVNSCTFRVEGIAELPASGVCEGTRAMDVTNAVWVEYEWMNGAWVLTGRTFDSATNTFL